MADHAAPRHKPVPAAAKASKMQSGPRPPTPRPPWRPPVNRTGLPDRLKSGVEALSGLSMDDVRVHRNSPEPAKLGALAYAQGSDIHLGVGQEAHLRHEAWHVVQQKQGRVSPTLQHEGMAINNDIVLEAEADEMAARACSVSKPAVAQAAVVSGVPVAQLARKGSTGKMRKKAKEKKASLKLDLAAREAALETAPEQTDTFHQYGDEHRNVDVDPDATGDDGVHLSGGRPEDAPVVERFRQVYNRLDSWVLYLERHHPEVLEQAEKKFKISDRHSAVSRIKSVTKAYKEKFRDESNLNIEIDRAEFEVEVEGEAQGIEDIIKKVSAYSAQKISNIDAKAVHAEGTEIWREKWKKAVQAVNSIIDSIWPSYAAKINKWIQKQSRIKENIKVGKLTYIGSLAKAYKGPPKQHIRFNPSNFDVDANLVAPSLADYAMRVDKLLPDRGRIFGRLTTIRPLIEFADAVQSALVARVEGIEDDPSDVFDVVIEASPTLEQEEAAAASATRLQQRDNLI